MKRKRLGLLFLAALIIVQGCATDRARKPAAAGDLVVGSGSCITFPIDDHTTFCTNSWAGGASATVRIGGDSYTIDSSKTYTGVDSNDLTQKIQAIANNGLTPAQTAHIMGPLTDEFKAYLADPQGVIGRSFEKQFIKFLLK